MSLTQKYRKTLRTFTITLLLMNCFVLAATAAEKPYSPRSADDVEVISLVLASEVKANSWTKYDLICFSVEGKDPDETLVKTLRQRGLNVCKLSEWQKHFSCGFHVTLRFISGGPPQTARLHADVADVREINSGVAHVAVRIRDGEYSLRERRGNWSIGDYIPSK